MNHMKKKLAIGIDIGGINTAFGLVDENGDLYAESVISTRKYPLFGDYPAYVADLCEALHALCDSVAFDYELAGIGIGAPNANYHLGTIEQPANLWKFPSDAPGEESQRIFRLCDDIKARFNGVEVLMTNDANAATLGEMVYGNARGMKDFIMITLGTGLGSGFVANGEMIYGHDGFAGEFGHVVVEHNNGRVCGCGRRGCLETYVSATGIKRTAFELMATMNEPSELRSIAFADFDASMVSVAASHGDKIALEAFRVTGEKLGRALADAVTITSPEAIFLFGGLAKAGELIFEPTRRYMEENMLAVFKGKVKLLPSGIEGKNAAILGASALIWQR